MEWDQVFLLLGAALGGGGVITSWITGRTTKRIETAKGLADRTKNELDAEKARLDRLQSMQDNLTESLQKENDRKDRRIEFLENKIAKLEGTAPRRASRVRKGTNE